MANTTMMFPNTVREFMEQFKMVDTEQIYSNGIEYVPIFRMEQWFAHQVDIPRWTPVTEKLPAYGENVLLSMNGDCSIGYLVPTYDERRYEWHHSGWFYFFNEVDAWMPLPEPYKGGGKK